MKCSVLVALVTASAGFLAACGPVGSDPADDGTEANSSTADTGARTTGSQSTTGSSTTGGGSGNPSTGFPDTGDVTSFGTDTVDPPSSTSAGSTSDTSSACVEDDGLRGALIIGGIDRVRIFRRDDVAGTCTWLTLASIPDGESPYEVDTPSPWVVESVAYNQVPTSCDTDFPAESGEYPIPDAWGTIALDPASPQLPCLADVDVQLQLLENPDPPVYVDLCHSMLPLDGC